MTNLTPKEFIENKLAEFVELNKEMLWVSTEEVVGIQEFIKTVASEAIEYGRGEVKSCPPHQLIDYHESGAWSASLPPPNKICSKCLITIRV